MTTNGRKKLGALAAVAFAVMAVPAQADPMTTGEPGDGGSWFQDWTQRNVAGGSFDMVAVKIFSAGDSFAPTEVTLLPGGWSVNFVSPSLVIFSSDSGADVSTLDFTLTYNGALAVQGALIETVFATFRDGGLIENFDANRGIPGQVFNLGNGWFGDFVTSWSDPSGDVALALIPLPAPIAMGALGLLGVVLGRKRLRRLAG